MILGELPVGSIITDKKTKFNGKPIKWLVADHGEYLLSSGVRTQATLLLSRDIIACRSFNNKPYTGTANQWKNSEIREWLNYIFRTYVSMELLGHIWSTRLLTDNRETDDTFFLLSYEEAGFGKQENALALFKKDSLYRIAEVCPGLKWSWWLRSPKAGNSYIARIVYADGSHGSRSVDNDIFGVRPAFIISDSIPVKKKKNGGYKFYWKEVTE